MRDSIKAKAARYSVQHGKDCGKCANCKEVARLKDIYEEDRTCTAALHEYLEASRLKPCTERGKK